MLDIFDARCNHEVNCLKFIAFSQRLKITRAGTVWRHLAVNYTQGYYTLGRHACASQNKFSMKSGTFCTLKVSYRLKFYLWISPEYKDRLLTEPTNQ